MEGVGVGEVIGDKFLYQMRTFSPEMFGASHGLVAGGGVGPPGCD